tara:strand:- start:539 stop:700 length:162 start_codon:yes stop_codon:yes gene_type:complete
MGPSPLRHDDFDLFWKDHHVWRNMVSRSNHVCGTDCDGHRVLDGNPQMAIAKD